DLSWASGGGSTNAFQIAYQTGATAPATCSAGNVIAAATQGATTFRAVSGLVSGTQYSFRVCATNGAGTLNSGVALSAMATAPVCAGDCYAEGSSPNFAQGLDIGTERQAPTARL
ncbi:fibronectin type III domain-containing protein, partial [bacterium]|nr:fibronectin type III domain-containing protein [bacterium]